MDMDRSRAMAEIRKLSYNLLVLIPACLPALGCSRAAPELPPEVKSEAVDPEKDPIEKMVDIPENFGDLQEVDPPKSNDSPKEAGTSRGETTKEK